MTVLDVIGLYYDAWANKRGDLSGVPLAPGFMFRGPVADFDDAEAYRAMAAQAGSLVSRFRCAAAVRGRQPGLLDH